LKLVSSYYSAADRIGRSPQQLSEPGHAVVAGITTSYEAGDNLAHMHDVMAAQGESE
jgi:hypothetical protein